MMVKALQETDWGLSLRALFEGILPADWCRVSSNAFFSSIREVESLLEIRITGLAINSKQVQPGDLFMASVGMEVDGRHYIKDAISNGAVAVLAEAGSDDVFSDDAVPIVKVVNLPHYIGLIAARFYGEPSKRMQVVGFTGTNGKTSCTQFLTQALSALNRRCGTIGTLGTGFLGHLKVTGLTTPDAVFLQRELSYLQSCGAESVAMEVSSHGLSQGRVQGVMFDTAVFTNLTVDHLDYHKSMDNYALAKKQFFLQPDLKSAVFNLDDPYGRVFAEEFCDKLTVYGFTMAHNALSPLEKQRFKAQNLDINMISAHHIRLTAEGFEVDVVTPWGDGVLSSSLLGRFNISNLLAVLTVLGHMGIPLKEALNSLAQVKTVAGRMETFGGGKQPLVVIDYAHTPDALEKALLALREHCHRKLWCVFGCGGNRDASKRRLMGKIAEQYSDQLIITDDNPRFEDAQQIVKDIVAGLLCPWAVEIEHDRGAAIAYAIQSAVAGDVVLIAGKGHEPYQVIGSDKFPFNDIEQARLQLSLK